MADVIDRETTQREVEEKVVTPQRPLVRWIEMLVFLGFAAIAAVAIWFLTGTQVTPDDGSFQVAEDIRFEQIGAMAGVIGFDGAEMMRFERIRDAAALEQEIAATQGFDYAEMMRFESLRPQISLDGFDVAEMMRFESLRPTD